MNIELLAVPPNIGFNAVATAFLQITRWLMLLIRWRGAVRLRPLPFQSLRSVVFPQSCGRRCVPCGTAPEGLDGPGALSELRVARGYTDTPVQLAPLDVGALVLPLRSFQPSGLDELVGPSFARPSCGPVPPAIEGTFACSLRARCDQISKRPVTSGVFAV